MCLDVPKPNGMAAVTFALFMEHNSRACHQQNMEYRWITELFCVLNPKFGSSLCQWLPVSCAVALCHLCVHTSVDVYV